MNFRPQKHRLSSDLLDSMVSELIEIKKNSLDKESFRNELVYKRFSNRDNPSLLTHSQINYLERKLTSDEISDYKLTQSLKKISKQLNKHMNTLINIFNKLSKE